jgi:hypothetical protein
MERVPLENYSVALLKMLFQITAFAVLVAEGTRTMVRVGERPHLQWCVDKKIPDRETQI